MCNVHVYVHVCLVYVHVCLIYVHVHVLCTSSCTCTCNVCLVYVHVHVHDRIIYIKYNLFYDVLKIKFKLICFSNSI